VSARLGHSNVYTTANVYAHALAGRDEEAVKKLEEFRKLHDLKSAGAKRV
jgi:integrase